ncbi:PREDICTED: uncharacterized protein LOC106751229 isoform X4 [Dinoponera quadriceps]|uniref:Uncharacterized protein LOC106751229 isoform X4 n=1 Tax=Dinoponera quadriceps TaxID=609295 RepID=A0A6P3Y912_DINQU|nr:PREDICTED: uncharacterized protein LOC106751229 isoform X4 [Dinoponera quadriceps]
MFRSVQHTNEENDAAALSKQVPEKLVLVKRESFNGWYNISSYFWALTITKIPEQMVLV